MNNKNLLLTLTLFHYLSPVMASDKNTSKDYESDYEIYEITARKHSQPYIEVPVSAVVIDGRDIALANTAALQSLTTNIPAVFAAPNSQSSKLFVRGVGSQGNAGMDQAVSVYIDDVFHSRSRMIKGALFDVQSVEILKGPQGTHFGLNTTAGAYVLRTNQAELNSAAGHVSLIYGDNDQLAVQYAKDHALSNDFALRTSLKASTDDGYWTMLDQQGNKTADSGTNEHALRLSALWKISDILDARARVEYQNIDKDNPFAWQPGGCNNLYGLGLSNQNEINAFWASTGSADNNPLRIPGTCREQFNDNQFDNHSPASPFNQSEFEYLTGVLQLTWQWSDLQLISNTAWFDMQYGFEGNDLSHGTSSQRLFYSTDENAQFSQELRLQAQLLPDLLFTAGGYWHRSETDYQTADADGRNRQNPRYVQSIAQQTETRTSLFTALEWQFWSDLTLDLGYRWSQTDKDFDGKEQRIQFNQLPDAQASAFSDTLFADVTAAPEQYNEFNFRTTAEFNGRDTDFVDQMPSVTLIYEASPELMTYYKWSKAAKSGGFNFRLNNLADTDLVYDPEEAIAHELGLKILAMQGQLQFEMAVFNSNYSNLQQNSNRGDDGIITGATIRNIAKAEANGVELNAKYHFNQHLSLSLMASWLDANFVDYQGADCTRLQSVVSRTDVAAQFGATRNGQACSQNLSGADMHMAPDFSGFTEVEYIFEPVADYQLLSGVQWFYSDGFFTSPHADPLRYQPHFNKLNLHATLRPNNANWQLSFVMKNLTDKLTSRQLGQDGNAAVSGLIDPPRHWSLNFHYDL